MRTNETSNEVCEIAKLMHKTRRTYLKHQANKYMYGFQKFEKIRSFSDSIYTRKINTNKNYKDQDNLLENIIDLMIKLNQGQNKVRIKK